MEATPAPISRHIISWSHLATAPPSAWHRTRSLPLLGPLLAPWASGQPMAHTHKAKPAPPATASLDGHPHAWEPRTQQTSLSLGGQRQERSRRGAWEPGSEVEEGVPCAVHTPKAQYPTTQAGRAGSRADQAEVWPGRRCHPPSVPAIRPPGRSGPPLLPETSQDEHGSVAASYLGCGHRTR